MRRTIIDTREYQALQETSGRRLGLLQDLGSLSLRVNSFREREPLLQYLVQRTVSATSADLSLFFLANRGDVALSAQAGPYAMRSAWSEELQSLAGSVNTRREPLLAHLPSEADKRAGLHVVAVPSVYRDRGVGVLVAARSERRRFSEEEITVLSIMASHAGVALSKVQELTRYEHHVKRMNAAQEIGNALVTSRDLDSILALIVERISEVIEADICSIMLLDDDGEHLSLAAAQGLTREVREATRIRLGEGLTGWMSRESCPLLVRDGVEGAGGPDALRPADRAASGRNGAHDGNGSGRQDSHGRPAALDSQSEALHTGYALLSVPLTVQGNLLGIINVNNKRSGRRFTEADRRLLTVFANQAAIAIENARLYKELEQMATTDAVTGIFNHRAFQERLAEEILRAERYGQPLSVILIDVDHFKRVNDTYGHLEGDHVLRELSALYTQTFRKMDYIARYGGEEFAVILPHSTRESAFRTADRVRKAVAGASLIRSNPVAKITVSMGVATYPEDGTEQRELLDRADQALYRAKEEGRNRVLTAVPLVRDFAEDEEELVAGI